MSLIITATDFSTIANDAVHYACQLAHAYKATVTVVHAYNIPVTFNENPMPVMPIEESRAIAQKSLDEMVTSLSKTYPGLQINSHLTFGDITEGIIDFAKNNKPWMAVVGNSLSEDDTYWFGGNLLQLMRDTPFPVLAIPHGIEFKTPHKICLACDYKKVIGHLPAQNLVNLVAITGASLQVLNIDHDNRSFGTDTPLESTELHKMIGEANPTYNYIDSEDIDEGIQNFIEQNNIDWLVVTPHKHGFIEGLFHKSRTKSIARHTHIPILALHEL